MIEIVEVHFVDVDTDLEADRSPLDIPQWMNPSLNVKVDHTVAVGQEVSVV